MAVPVEALTAANLTALDEDAAAWLLAVYSSGGKGEGAGSKPRGAAGALGRGALGQGALGRAACARAAGRGPAPVPPHPLAPPMRRPGAADAACADALAKFDAAARGAQAVVRYGRLDAAGASAGEARLLKAMGVDVAALEAEPCALQLVLLPHGAGKEEIDEYKL
jgi:hypothetical protein